MQRARTDRPLRPSPRRVARLALAAAALTGCDVPEASVGGGPTANTPAVLASPLLAALAVSASPAGGLFASGPTVTLTASHAAAAIFFTGDGSDPAVSPTRVRYAGPFALPESTTLRAVAEAGGARSPVTEAIFVVRMPAPLPGEAPLPELRSLKRVAVPQPSNLGQFVKNRQAAIALGKALFWDVQVGSDGQTACASCHFHAGADNRAKNQINPGLAALTPDVRFGFGGPNYLLRREDFPLHKLANPDDRSSTPIWSRNDVVSSQGVFNGKYVFPGKGIPERVDYAGDSIFNVAGIQTRRVEPRNTPSTINAVFNYRNFWDGRAQHEFNGVNPFGSRDQNARVVKVEADKKNKKQLALVAISLDNSSLASQAVGPVLSPFEMSADGRTFPHVGIKFAQELKGKAKKLGALQPLGQQQVSGSDGVLAPYVAPGGRGLTGSYAQMIAAAFKDEWWNEDKQFLRVDRTTGQVSFVNGAGQLNNREDNEFSVMEYNFSLFFGLAVQMYEATLVSDDTPFDRYLDGAEGALGASEKRGLVVFQTKGKCIDCHGGGELTNASVDNVRNDFIERMVMGNGQVASYDNGFYNIGVRPTAEDVGVGGADPFGKPLSFTRLAGTSGRVAVDGAFKTPGLRNVALTAPYFHNGGQLTLLQLVQFYNRGADFHAQNLADLDPDIETLGLSAQERADLVAFLHALTDDRVRRRAAPFDHPQLRIPNGHPGDHTRITGSTSGRAHDDFVEIPATGAAGGTPLRSFLE